MGLMDVLLQYTTAQLASLSQDLVTEVFDTGFMKEAIAEMPELGDEVEHAADALLEQLVEAEHRSVRATLTGATTVLISMLVRAYGQEYATEQSRLLKQSRLGKVVFESFALKEADDEIIQRIKTQTVGMPRYFRAQVSFIMMMNCAVFLYLADMLRKEVN